MHNVISALLIISLALCPSAASARVVISEVLWMGSDLSTADEWLEIASDSDSPQSLSGWTITSLGTSGTEQTIARFGSSAVLGAGEHAVISNYSQEASRLAVRSLLITSSLSLPNTKLLLRLRDPSGAIVDEVDDGIGVPFAGLNVSGQPKASMERVSLSGSGTDKANWRTAIESVGFDEGSPMRGTPGHPNGSVVSSASSSISSQSSYFTISSEPYTEPLFQKSDQEKYSSIFLSEVLPDPEGSDAAEWLEIHNASGGAVDLAGLKVSVGTRTYVLPHGASGQTLIQSGGYLVLPQALTKLTLVNGGSTVRLLTASGTLLDELIYPALSEGVSFGRIARGLEPKMFCIPSPGAAAESSPPDVRIQIQSLTVGERRSVNMTAALPSRPGGFRCSWDFGDGMASQTCNPGTHSFSVTGSYIVTLTAADACGETSSHTLQLYPLPAEGSMCIPSTFDDIQVSEIYPIAGPGEEEWIELRNASEMPADLCGWSVDDEEGGSRAARLEGQRIEPGGYLWLPTSKTHLTLNDAGDEIRLIAPLPQGGTGIVLTAAYREAPEWASLLWTGNTWKNAFFPTPGAPNAQRPDTSLWETPLIVVRAVLPNPQGKDGSQEWVEIENRSGRPQWLNGWQLQSGTSELPLHGQVLASGESRRLYTVGHLSLRNATGSVLLVAPDGTTSSLLAWDSPKDGEVIVPQEFGDRISGVVMNVQSGALLVQRAGAKNDLMIVHPYGVKALSKLHQKIIDDTFSALLKEKNIDLFLYSKETHEAVVMWQGRDLSKYLLQEGLGVLQDELVISNPVLAAWQLQGIGRSAGIWSDPVQRHLRIAHHEELKVRHALSARTYRISMDRKGGIVSSGTVVTLKASRPSRYFVSQNDGPFLESSGSILVLADLKMRAYAVPILASVRAPEEFKTDVVRTEFLVQRDSYPDGVRISEVYPSPNKGEEEWIEIRNISNSRIALGGWMFRKTTGKPKSLPLSLGIDPGELLILPSALTGLKLKNTGDTFELVSPDGAVVDSLHYPSVKNGLGFIADDAGCITTVPTPAADNICKAVQKAVKKKSAKSSSSKKKSSSSKESEAAGLLRDLKSGSGAMVELPAPGSAGTPLWVTALLVIACAGCALLAFKRRI